MLWASLAIISAVLFSFVLAMDKLLLARYVPSTKSFCFLVGIVQLVMAALIMILHPWSSSPTVSGVSIGLLSGIIWGLSVVTIIYGVRELEVSRVIPIASTYPVFVALIAVPVLNERFSVIQYSSILLTVLGAGLLARNGLQIAEGPIKRTNQAIYLVVLFGSVLSALAHVTYKHALTEIEFWDLFFLRSLCCFIVWSIWGLHAGLLGELRYVFGNKQVLGLFVFSECVILPIAVTSMVAGLALGPVSIVSTLLSTRPLFVLIISGLLSTSYWNLLNEPFSKNVLPTKLLFTSMIVIGVVGVLI